MAPKTKDPAKTKRGLNFLVLLLHLAPLAALSAACKPNSNLSRAFTDGGAASADWALLATLMPDGRLQLSPQGGNASGDGAVITDVSVKVGAAAAVQGAMPDAKLAAGKFLALDMTEDLSHGDFSSHLDVLLITADQRLCTASGVAPAAANGDTGVDVHCQADQEAADQYASRRRAELRQVCGRLAASPTATSTNVPPTVAKYVEDADGCDCLNGKPRRLRFSDYTAGDLASFEYACRANPTATTGVGSLPWAACASAVDLFPALGNGAKALPDGCQCGGSMLKYAAERYQKQPDLLRQDCAAALYGKLAAISTATGAATGSATGVATGSSTGTAVGVP